MPQVAAILEEEDPTVTLKAVRVQPRFVLRRGNPWRIAWAANGGRRDVAEVQKYLEWRLCDAGSASWQALRGEVAEEKAAANAEVAAARERDVGGRFARCATIDGTPG